MKIQEWLCVARTDPHRVARSRSILFWAGTGATVLMLLTLGFFLHRGVMGLYIDDYSLKAWAFDFGAGKWNLRLTPFDFRWTLRPLAHILAPNLANAIPQHEFPVRVGIVVIHFLNVWLLAKLAQRLSGSFLVGIICGGYFLFPIFANEGLLWFGAAITDIFSLLFLLLGFHFLLSCRSFADSLLLVCGVVSWLVMITFYESGLFTILLLPIFFGLTQMEARRANSKLWVSALAASFAPICLYLGLVERHSQGVVARGGATLDLGFIVFHKVPEVVRGFWWLITDWGIFGPLHEAFRLGWREWRSVSGGQILMDGTLLGICLIALLYPTDRDAIPPSARLFKLMLIGFGWIVLGLVPMALIRFQIVEIRTLYVPSAGFALSAAAISGLVCQAPNRWRAAAIRGILVITGAAVFVSSLTMAGLVRAYQLRWYLDQKQVATMRPVLSQFDRTEPLRLLPVTLDERTVGKYWGKETVLDRYLLGFLSIRGRPGMQSA